MPDEIATLKRELADLRKQVAQGGEPQDGMQMAVNEVRAQFETDVENGKMKDACKHVFADGSVCGLGWKDPQGNVWLEHRGVGDNVRRHGPFDSSRPDHSWRSKPIVSIPPQKGSYSKDAQTSLMSEEDAMKELDVDADELRGMGLSMVKAKGNYLYRRGEVMEIAALV